MAASARYKMIKKAGAGGRGVNRWSWTGAGFSNTSSEPLLVKLRGTIQQKIQRRNTNYNACIADNLHFTVK